MSIRNFLTPEDLQIMLDETYGNQQTQDFIRPNPLQFQYPYIPGGITNVSPQQTFQDYYSGVYEPYDPEKDDEQVDYLPGQYSFKDKIGNFLERVAGKPGISSIIGAFNPLAGLVTRGIGALGKALGPQFIGVRGGQNLYSDTGFNTFAKSTSLVDFLQRRRDQKARDEAAARGAAKQAEAARLQAMKAVRNTGGGNGGGSVESRGGGASYGTRQESGWESSPF